MTGISTMGSSLDQIERLKNLQSQLNLLSTQLSTGKKTQTFSGLGSQVTLTQRTRTSLRDIDSYAINIETADRRLNMMTNAYNEIERQGNTLLDFVKSQEQGEGFDIASAGDMAKKIRDFITDLVNERDGDRYIFGGTDTLTKPLSDNGLIDSYLQEKISAWADGTLSSNDLIDSYSDDSQLTDTTVGYSAAMSSDSVRKVTGRLDANKEIEYGALANEPAIRDLLVAASMLENMAQVMDSVATDPDGDSGQVTAPGVDTQTQKDNFNRIFTDITEMLASGIKGVQKLNAATGQAQLEVKQAKEDQAAEKNILLDRLGAIEDVDLNEIAVKLDALTTQIEASYRMTATIQDMSLINFLPIS